MTTNRRSFLRTASAASAFTIVPRSVLGGAGFVPPSDKITLGYIGTGTQGLREMLSLLAVPEIQITAVCDPSRYAVGYRDWNKDGLLNSIRRAIGKPEWRPGAEGEIPGGRDAAKDVVDSYYAKERSADRVRGCNAYADPREMFDREKDLSSVKIITPDHLHGVLAVAALKRGKHVMIHKPIANRLREAKLVVDTSRERKLATYFIPWDSNAPMDNIMAAVKSGAIGTLREVHNWTNRPVWPQYITKPIDTPPVPDGFDWDLWLGPEAERPYHPNYTHMVFRGWYDFGAGTMADMGHYSLWSVFNALELAGPTAIEPLMANHVMFDGNVPRSLRNDFSFPSASIVRLKYPAVPNRPAVDLIWYDGGMRPPLPLGVEELGREGMMFVGDRGAILGDFYGRNARILREGRSTPIEEGPRTRERGEISPTLRAWVDACRGTGQISSGTIAGAWPISEAVNLWAVALRAGRRLTYDAAAMSVTNDATASKYLARDYRKGWSPETI